METKKRKSMAVITLAIMCVLESCTIFELRKGEGRDRNYDATCARGHPKHTPEIFMCSP